MPLTTEPRITARTTTGSRCHRRFTTEPYDFLERFVTQERIICTMIRTLACLFSAFVAVTALADADLLVFIDSTNNRFVEPGTTATFTAFVRNFGPDVATNLRLRLPLPPQSKLVSLTTKGGWTCSGTDAEVNCTLATLAVNRPSEDATSVTATAVLSSDPNGQVSRDTTTVTADTPDSKPLNNES